MDPRKFTSYRGQGGSVVVRFPRKILKEKKLVFFWENAIASDNKQLWIEIERHISFATVASPS